MTDNTIDDKRAPMASAPIKYGPDGEVDWGNMWDSFCALAQEGGPPHRPTMLHAQVDADVESPTYQAVVAEITRGITAVSDLPATPAGPGWIAVQCPSSGMAIWVGDAINQENVAARVEGDIVLVPAGEHFSVKNEIKNVITAVAKTTHYWQDHIPSEVKLTLGLQARLSQFSGRVKGWLGKTRA